MRQLRQVNAEAMHPAAVALPALPQQLQATQQLLRSARFARMHTHFSSGGAGTR